MRPLALPQSQARALIDRSANEQSNLISPRNKSANHQTQYTALDRRPSDVGRRMANRPRRLYSRQGAIRAISDAQVLGQSLAGAKEVKPWPWADTWPVGRLEMFRLGVDQFVLAGASGRTLAFGPGHLTGTALPGDSGNTVLSGHRDTHFKFLQHLQLGDEIVITAVDGAQFRYEISSAAVVNYRDTRVTMGSHGRKLTLVTCYPFRSINPGGDKRYVVIAHYLPPRETNRAPRKRMLAVI